MGQLTLEWECCTCSAFEPQALLSGHHAQDFTLLARDVELLLEGDCPNHFRILSNTNLTVVGPLMMVRCVVLLEHLGLLRAFIHVVAALTHKTVTEICWA